MAGIFFVMNEIEKKIFIIEDNAIILSSMLAKFSVSGWDVFASGGSDQMEVIIKNLESTDPNCIVLDLFLPYIDGFQLLKKIKEKTYIKSLVFVYSEKNEKEIKTKCLNMGADYYISKKQINIDELVQKVDKIFFNINKNKKSK